ncbi:hypothetical protein Y699_03547 [Aspergillus terreus]|uniref:Uncharacterized protein n=1 Tax=Aspergillus terreus TaxID=33178 RepID=A0A5M3Z7A9_ASPTE|nr:hypothetical protein ATETN484_0008039000 [Aspergillus terreus]GFF21218.1 hypothetical protein Y699_03547 [Aspergillus terreus]
MDIVQKYGYLKHDRERRSSRTIEEEIAHYENQQALNSLLGRFGHPDNDHPDRRSSGAGNMTADMREANRRLSMQDSMPVQNPPQDQELKSPKS